ncbi:non-ribosomal peptide synthetase [Rhodococcus sp. NPDC060176]|uniref:non-ribosomal peptide synthetase n=1 Tax=Rhodococcus sp. NPDC060176 TaxID=3347062 RepID=UPI00364A374F
MTFQPSEQLPNAHQNHLRTAAPLDFLDFFVGTGLKTSDAPALRDSAGYALTYRQLTDAIAGRARDLSSAGVGPGQLIRVSAARNSASVVELLAVLAVGAAFVALAPDAVPSPRIQEALGGAAMPPDAAYVMSTSGSTGEPKETVVTRTGLRHVFHALRKSPEIDFPSGLVWTQFHPLTFGYAMCEILGALSFGGEIVIVDREESLTCSGLCHTLISARAGGRRVAVCLTPSELSLLTTRIGESDVRAPEFVLLSGEPAYRGQLAEFFALPAANQSVVVNTYAATETAGQVTAHRVTENSVPELMAGYVGHPLPGVGVTLVASDGKTLRRSNSDTPGDIYVEGPMVAAGYLDAEQTAARFRPTETGGAAFRTGDIGQWAKDGGLRIVGRNGRRYKIAGRWVPLDFIERYILTSECVSDVAASIAEVCLDGATPLECLQIVAVPCDRSVAGAERIRRQVVASLAAPLTIRLILVDALPRNLNGKLSSEYISTATLNPPTMDVATAVCAVWVEILGAGVGQRTNLFESGVDSLGIVTAAARLTRALCRPVSAEFLLDHPRIELQISALTTPSRKVSDPPASTGAARRVSLPDRGAQRRNARRTLPVQPLANVKPSPHEEESPT